MAGLTDASGGATGSLISESGLEPVVSAILGVWRRENRRTFEEDGCNC